MWIALAGWAGLNFVSSSLVERSERRAASGRGLLSLDGDRPELLLALPSWRGEIVRLQVDVGCFRSMGAPFAFLSPRGENVRRRVNVDCVRWTGAGSNFVSSPLVEGSAYSRLCREWSEGC